MRLADLHAQHVLSRRQVDGIRLACIIRQCQRRIIRAVWEQVVFKFREGNDPVEIDFPADAQLAQAILLIARGNGIKSVFFDGKTPFDPLALLRICAASNNVQCNRIRIVRADRGRRAIVGRNDGGIRLRGDHLGFKPERLCAFRTLCVSERCKIVFIALRSLGN